MYAYVDLIQRKEKELGCDVLTHQKWYDFRFLVRGLADWKICRLGVVLTILMVFCQVRMTACTLLYCADVLRVILAVSSGSSSTSSIGTGSTEHSF